MKNIILCADDYGQNPDISRGIIKLIKAKKITATSCMVNSKFWKQTSEKLKPYLNQIDIGLHFNLTHGLAMGEIAHLTQGTKLPSLKKLMIYNFFKKFRWESIALELDRQLECFKSTFGRYPDFIDGHQHIHQLSQVRKAIKYIWKTKLYNHRLYFRNTFQIKTQNQSFKARLKGFIIKFTGAFGLQYWLRKNHILHNESFAGVYNFADLKHYTHHIHQPKSSIQKYYKNLFKKILFNIQNNGLIMCHPGASKFNPKDPIYFARELELNFFLSETFDELLAENHIQLIRGVDL